MRRVVVLCALVALLGHVCALDAGDDHRPERAQRAGPVHPWSGEYAASDPASCDGLNPTSLGPAASALENRPVGGLGVAGTPSSRIAPPPCQPVPGRTLYLAHRALLL